MRIAIDGWRTSSLRIGAHAELCIRGAIASFSPQLMKTRLLKAVSLVAIGFFCSTARATLIGDTITLDVVYAGAPIPNVNDHKVVTVQAGSGDVVQMGVMDQFFAVNPEADTLFLTFNREADGTSSFFGLSITGIDDTLLGVTVSSNTDLSGPPLFKWNSDGKALVWDDHSVLVDWTNVFVRQGDYFNITLITSRSVPDSGATSVLLGASLVFFIGLRRRMRLGAK
jgi:hypothetical protein